MSIKDNFPSVGPSLSLNFARSKTLDPRITFSRTSSATRVNETGLIEVMSADEPRFDHKYENGVVKSLGLLVEESRINYEQNTEDPSQWTILNMVPTGNSVTLPTGEVSTTIEYQGETTDANNKLIRPLPTGAGPTAGETWVFSIFLKAGTEDTTRLQLQNNTGGDSVGRTFNMVTGEWTENLSVQGPNTGDSGYEYYGNGWYRVWLVNTYSATAAGQQTFMRLNANSSAVPLTTSFSAWGAQLEKGSFPTSYIPNDTGLQKTRNPDNVSMTGTNFSDWYNQNEGTIFTSFSTLYEGSQRTGTTPGVFGLSQTQEENSLYNGYGALIRSDTRLISFSHRVITDVLNVNNALLGDITPTTIQPNTKYEISCSYANNELARSIDGNSVATRDDSNYGLLPKTTLYIGFQRVGGSPPLELTGHISQLTYYPRRLTNEQLQNLTK